MPEERKFINPYNFVPLGKVAPQRKPFPGLHRLPRDSYSGVLHCQLTALGPVFTADPRDPGSNGRRYSFLKNGAGQALIQGTSLRGMVRAVFEAVTASCLCLASPRGRVKDSRGEWKRYQFPALDDFSSERCATIEALCPACRLFGMVDTRGNDKTSDHAASRLVFEDAVFSTSKLRGGKMELARQWAPRPYHYPIYSKTEERGGEIAGRKFYYHHDRPAEDPVGGLTLKEYLPGGASVNFLLRFHGLAKGEISALLWCLELGREDDLAHKLGLGKALGLGSCKIRVADEESSVFRGNGRYLSWQRQPLKSLLNEVRREGPASSSELRDLLRVSKHKGKKVGYPASSYYKISGPIRIHDDGAFDPQPRSGSGPASPSGLGTLGPGLLSIQNPGASVENRQDEGPLKGKKKVDVEVLGLEDGRYQVRIIATGQEVRVKRRQTWQIGERRKIKVLKADPTWKKVLDSQQA